MADPSRGDVWLANLDPTVGHETGRRRPCVVVSNDMLNHGPAQLVVIIPLTTRQRHIPYHVAISPPEGGLRQLSLAKCEEVRSVSVTRLVDKWGAIASTTMQSIEDRLKIVLQLR